MKNKLSFLLPFFIVVLLGSYLFFKKTDQTNEPIVEKEILESMVPDNFIEFYMRFHLDTLFQSNHITFPLKEKADGSVWTRSSWIHHKPFNNYDGEFVQNFRYLNGLIFEIIQDRKGQFRIEKRYVKNENSYNLIYYSVVNAFESNEEWEDEN